MFRVFFLSTKRNFLFLAYCISYPSAPATFFQDRVAVFFFLFLTVSLVTFFMLVGVTISGLVVGENLGMVVGAGLVVGEGLGLVVGIGVGNCGGLDGNEGLVFCLVRVSVCPQIVQCLVSSIVMPDILPIVAHSLHVWPRAGITSCGSKISPHMEQ